MVAARIIGEYEVALKLGIKSVKKIKMYFLSTISRMYNIGLIDTPTYTYIKEKIKFSQLNGKAKCDISVKDIEYIKHDAQALMEVAELFYGEENK